MDTILPLSLFAASALALSRLPKPETLPPPAPNVLSDTILETLQEDSKEVPFYKFVLTGGPCGGKTTALARVSSFLRQRGYSVYTVPEAATIMFGHGASTADFGIDNFSFNFQVALMKCQMQLEDTFETVGRATYRPTVLLCDRGLMDGKAYLPEEEWDKMVRRMGIKTDIDIREGRYNAVFHLVSAALGAEKFYTTTNNRTRMETVDEAKAQVRDRGETTQAQDQEKRQNAILVRGTAVRECIADNELLARSAGTRHWWRNR